MIVTPSNFLKADTRFKHWGKKFTCKDFDEAKEKGFALGGKFVQWNSSVALGDGEFMVVAAEVGSRARYYNYVLVMGGEKEAQSAIAIIDGRESTPSKQWDEFIAAMPKVFPEAVVAKAMNNRLYSFGLFSAWMAIQAEGGPEPESVDLSGVGDEDLAAELTRRGWCCEREADAGIPAR